jgi:hypothetical protein
MVLNVLHVAYPFALVGPSAGGGAEQVLGYLDQALVAARHRSIVVACAGSGVHGTLIPVPRTNGPIDAARRSSICSAQQQAIASALANWPIDLVHLHGIDFHTYLPPPGIPTLVTLHLPVAWYAHQALKPDRPDTWFNCVSATQHADCGTLPGLLPAIENGVPTEALNVRHAKRPFALMLARICPEKGVHVAIEAAKRADIPLVIAGNVYDYADHRRYFDEEVVPRLDDRRRFIGPVDFRRKRRLLAAAQCVLVPSLVAETSCLVAREALAAGTPVVAFDRGALREAVEHGRTGFLVRDCTEMADAIRTASALDAEVCRRTAQARFGLEPMITRYFALYHRLAARSLPWAAAS